MRLVSLHFASLHFARRRLGLARLAGQNNVEGELWMMSAKLARKSKIFHLAQPALAHARVAFGAAENLLMSSSDKEKIELENAKLKHDMGESSAALRMVEFKSDEAERQYFYNANNGSKGRAYLSGTEWMVESGMAHGAEVMMRYKKVITTWPNWEVSERAGHERSEPRAKRATSEAINERNEPRAMRASHN